LFQAFFNRRNRKSLSVSLIPPGPLMSNGDAMV
jgi:hypothetical protein